jgi:hypothetical protein
MKWDNVLRNVKEAREQLEDLERMIADPTARTEGKLVVGLEHAYHHLNFAWHTRRIARHRYPALTTADFNRFGAFPRDVHLARLPAGHRLAPNRKRRSKRA